jgi:hypothetical protein
MNAKEELIHLIHDVENIKCGLIYIYTYNILSEDFYVEYYTLDINYSLLDLNVFLNILEVTGEEEKEYQEKLYGTIWLKDDGFLSANINNVNGWWVYNKTPEIPLELYQTLRNEAEQASFESTIGVE